MLLKLYAKIILKNQWIYVQYTDFKKKNTARLGMTRNETKKTIETLQKWIDGLT